MYIQPLKVGPKRVLIGKTVYLTYCLMNRLVEKKPTLLAISPVDRFLFLESGVYRVQDYGLNLWDDPEIVGAGNGRLDGLVLFDLNTYQGTSTIPRRWRVLVASSPKPLETYGWVKENLVKKYYMKTWSWEEIYICSK